MGNQRVAGDVYLVSGSANVGPPTQTVTSAVATTSGGVTIISVNCTGAESFALTNYGSINIYVNGSFDDSFFVASVAVLNPANGASANAVSASTVGTFAGPYRILRVIANSGSGVYRANLLYR